MEDDRNFVSLPPSPSLAFIHGNNNEILTLCPISPGEEPVEKNTPYDLLNKNIGDWFYGWLVVWDEEEIHYSLWSPAQTIHLPALSLKPEHKILYHKILTSPPGNSDCMLILFEKTGPSLIYCMVGDQQQWKEQLVSPNFKQDNDYYKDDYPGTPVMCNGRIYCTTRCCRGLAAIDVKPDGLAFSFLDLYGPFLRTPWQHLREYLVESFGEIFNIHLLLNGLNGEYEWEEVFAVHVYKLDLPRKEWESVQSFKDRAFFLTAAMKFSCPATLPGIEGNHIYFQLYADDSLYSYNMEDGTVLFSIPCPNLLDGWSTSFWIVPDTDLRIKDVGEEINPNSDVAEEEMNEAGQETKSKDREIVKDCTIEEGGDIGKLPLDILVGIGRCLGLQDYMSFRAVNKLFRLAAPIEYWRRNTCLPAWMVFCRVGDTTWNFIDPLHQERHFEFPNNELEDVRLCYSKGGWCVMLHNEDCIFLWNPFAKKTIHLPNLQPPYMCDHISIAGCSFSSSPDSLESDCTVVLLFSFGPEYRINFINLGGEKWTSYFFECKEHISLYKDNYPVYWDGAFYFLDEMGNLGVYRKANDEENVEGEGHREEDGDIIGDEDTNGRRHEDRDAEGKEHKDGDGGEEEGHREEHKEIIGDDGGDEDTNGRRHEDGDAEGKEHRDGDVDEEEEEEEEYKDLDHVIESPCESFHQKFLLECDGKLLSVFVGFLGEWVQIFRFDESKLVWVEVSDLGNHTLYISRFSAFSTIASPGMQNRIYFPRFHGKNSVVYYSLDSGKLHSHGTEEVLEDLYHTKEQLICGWITPKF
ncbi:hypothetical protein SLA2020_323130 [Shorea laevis]